MKIFSLQFLRIVFDCVKFFTLATLEKDDREVEEETIGEWLKRNGFSTSFIHKFLIPVMSSICTCCDKSAASYPADVVLKYHQQKLYVGVKRARDGMTTVAKKLSENVKDLRCGVSIKAITPKEGHKKLIVIDEDGREEVFDQVILGVQSNTALKLLDPQFFTKQRKVLQKFRYEKSTVVVHKDSLLMPPEKENWSALNLLVDETQDKPMATIWMNVAQTGLAEQTSENVFQTWNPHTDPHPSKVISSSEFERPIVDCAARRGQRQLSGLQGVDGLWFCGAYVMEGIPLLEAGCESGLRAAESLGASCPWKIHSSSSSSSLTLDEPGPTQKQNKNKRQQITAPSSPSTLTLVKSWVSAARPAAHAAIALPLLIGELYGAHLSPEGSIQIDKLVLGHIIALLMQCFLLFTNDIADRKCDGANKTYSKYMVRISGGSRVLQEGKLKAVSLLKGALVCLLLVLLVGAYLHLRYGLHLVFPFLFCSLAVCWTYSLPPGRFSYSGYGEIVQSFGCGVVLPVFGFYLQHPSLSSFPFRILYPLFTLFFVSNLTTALPDVPSDAAHGKRTYPVKFGVQTTKNHILFLFTLLLISFPLLVNRNITSIAFSLTSYLFVLLPAASCHLILFFFRGKGPQVSSLFLFLSVASQAWVLFSWVVVLFLTPTTTTL